MRHVVSSLVAPGKKRVGDSAARSEAQPKRRGRRLAQLIRIAESGDPKTDEELARLFGVSKRTVIRGFDLSFEAGVQSVGKSGESCRRRCHAKTGGYHVRVQFGCESHGSCGIPERSRTLSLEEMGRRCEFAGQSYATFQENVHYSRATQRPSTPTRRVYAAGDEDAEPARGRLPPHKSNLGTVDRTASYGATRR